MTSAMTRKPARKRLETTGLKRKKGKREVRVKNKIERLTLPESGTETRAAARRRAQLEQATEEPHKGQRRRTSRDKLRSSERKKNEKNNADRESGWKRRPRRQVKSIKGNYRRFCDPDQVRGELVAAVSGRLEKLAYNDLL